jgi:hypothetical protein
MLMQLLRGFRALEFFCLGGRGMIPKAFGIRYALDDKKRK